MFFDLNVSVPNIFQSSGASSKKGKGKQQTTNNPIAFTSAQISVLEARVDLLVRLGYTVIAFNQLVYKKIDPKSHVNTLESLLSQLRKRPGIIFLKRLSIILDEDSEKGFGLTNANASLFPGYDLIGLIPMTQATFSLACLTHSMPSPITAHIISLPLTLPRLSFHLKHTLIRTAIKNGAVFEISYVGALGGENDPTLLNAGAAENGPSAKRNWWAAAKEISRVTKGKSIIISGGVVSEADLRAPKDVANLITLLGLPQDAAHNCLTKIPKSLVLRAQTRNTYRAVLSEPKLVVPEESAPYESPPELVAVHPPTTTEDILPSGSNEPTVASEVLPSYESNAAPALKKRPREGDIGSETVVAGSQQATNVEDSQKKKRKKNNKGAQRAP